MNATEYFALACRLAREADGLWADPPGVGEWEESAVFTGNLARAYAAAGVAAILAAKEQSAAAEEEILDLLRELPNGHVSNDVANLLRAAWTAIQVARETGGLDDPARSVLLALQEARAWMDLQFCQGEDETECALHALKALHRAEMGWIALQEQATREVLLRITDEAMRTANSAAFLLSFNRAPHSVWGPIVARATAIAEAMAARAK